MKSIGSGPFFEGLIPHSLHPNHQFSNVLAHSLKRMMPEENGEGTARISGSVFPARGSKRQTSSLLSACGQGSLAWFPVSFTHPPSETTGAQPSGFLAFWILVFSLCCPKPTFLTFWFLLFGSSFSHRPKRLTFYFWVLWASE